MEQRPIVRYAEIKRFFEQNRFPMNKIPENGRNYITSKQRNHLAFFIRSDERQFQFYWKTYCEDRLKLMDKLPQIRKRFPSAHAKPGQGAPQCTYLYIDIDPPNYLQTALEVVKATKSIVGYIV